jgi:four helix bundle protein
MGDQVYQGYHGKRRKAGFESLWIWQEAYALLMEIADKCKTLPRDERFRLRDQIERSSSSVADNIAEGYATYYYNDKIKSMNVSRKEAGETQNHIRIMEGERYITSPKADEWIDRYERLIIGINNYKKYILEKRENEGRKGVKSMIPSISRIPPNP